MTDFSSPTHDQVRAAIRRIPTFPLRRAFFEGLRNPLWVAPLGAEGAFSGPPEPEFTKDGYVRDLYWPEIDYLIRMAPLAPREVVDVLLTFRASRNAWVRRGAFAIGAVIPPTEAARLEPLIESWKSSGFGGRTDPNDLITLAVRLIEGGQEEVGCRFADLIFGPPRRRKKGRPSLVLESYWYEQGMPQIAAALGPQHLSRVLGWLVAYERKARHLSRTFDNTYIGRDAIREPLDGDDDLERVLIDAVRDLAIQSMRSDVSTAVSLLTGSGMILGRKIALFSVSQALEQACAEGESTSCLLIAAEGLLADRASWNDACRIDFADLARAVARMTGQPIPEFRSAFDSMLEATTERLDEYLRAASADEAALRRDVQSGIKRWKHLWLAAVGEQALPPDLVADLVALNHELGVVEDPLAPSPSWGSWSGPNSPLSQDDMAAMAPEELAEHLEGWRYTGSGFGPEPSHEGQARTLVGLLAVDPLALTGVEGLVHRLRPTYVSGLFQGWEAAFKAGQALGWTQVCQAIRDVLALDSASPFQVEGPIWDDDADYEDAKRAAVGLLEELAHVRRSPAVPASVMAELAHLLIGLARSADAWRVYLQSSNNSAMDALTASLSFAWPTRLRGLIHLLHHGQETAWFGAARAALIEELNREDPTGASQAVIGEGIGRILAADPAWVEVMSPEWFGSGEPLSVSQQIALTTALATHGYHPKLRPLLASGMVRALESVEPVVAGWKTDTDPLQRIGEWVVVGIMSGDVTAEDAVAHAFFTLASPEVRGAAMGHVAWSLLQAETVDDDFLDRLAHLWDQRVAYVRQHQDGCGELAKFYWFVKCGRFAPEWWLPRLEEVVRLCPESARQPFMIGKEIARAAETDPRRALDVLVALLEARDQGDMTSYELTRHSVPTVLARAIDHGDEQLRGDAERFMNKLGEKGHITLEQEVTNVRGKWAAQ